MRKRLAIKNRVIRFLKKRFFLRFHMSLILSGTFLTGLLVTKILLHLQVNNMFIRYSFAVIFSYLAFFAFVKIWLWYVRKNQSANPLDVLDIALNAPEPSGGGTDVPFIPGGGKFGGGGASGSFDSLAMGKTAVLSENGVLTHEVSALEGLKASSGVKEDLMAGVPETFCTASSGINEGSSAAGEAAGSALEEGGILLIVLGALLAVIFGAGIYLVYQAPVILSEAAFDFLLASSLIRGAKKLDRPDWMSGVLRTTWIPFVSILILSLIFAGATHRLCPQAARLSEVFRVCLFQ